MRFRCIHPHNDIPSFADVASDYAAPVPAPRRTTREHCTPQYLSDYVCGNVVANEVFCGHTLTSTIAFPTHSVCSPVLPETEPTSFAQACNFEVWQDAINAEL